MKTNNYFPFTSGYLILTAAVIIIAFLLTFSIRSVIVAWRGSAPVPITNNAATVEDQAIPSPPAAAPFIADKPGAAPVSVQSSQATPDLPREDFETIWRREEAQREAIRVLREEARENPNAEGIPTEKEIEQLEKSGALLM